MVPQSTPNEQTQQNGNIYNIQSQNQNGNIYNIQSQNQNVRHQSKLQEQIPTAKLQNDKTPNKRTHPGNLPNITHLKHNKSIQNNFFDLGHHQSQTAKITKTMKQINQNNK